MRIGYARTSTTDQQAGFEAQVRVLEAVGCEKIYQEQVSSTQGIPELPIDALLPLIPHMLCCA
jgi:DNA invertase Pin-like site-specific DNA recombinase